MPGVKITRKEIKRNELATTIGGLTAAVERHQKSVAIALGAIILLAAAVAGGVWFSRSRAAAARLKLAAVQKAVAAPTAEEGSLPAPGATSYVTRRQKYEEVVRLAGVVLSEHPSSAAAKWASYYKAVGQKELGNLTESLETLTPLAADTGNEFLSCSAQFLQAQIHEAQGDLAQAANLYAGIAALSPSRFPAEMALMNQARLLEVQGKDEEARDIYRRVTQEYPDSPYSQEASRRMSPAAG